MNKAEALHTPEHYTKRVNALRHQEVYTVKSKANNNTYVVTLGVNAEAQWETVERCTEMSLSAGYISFRAYYRLHDSRDDARKFVKEVA